MSPGCAVVCDLTTATGVLPVDDVTMVTIDLGTVAVVVKVTVGCWVLVAIVTAACLGGLVTKATICCC